MMSLPKRLQNLPLSRSVILLLLVLLVGIGAVPGYLGGKWPWQRVPQVTALKELQNLRKQGLTLVGWPTLNYQVIKLGGHKWILQEVGIPASAKRPGLEGDKIDLLLLPQEGTVSQPQVEWTDIIGSQRWETDSLKKSSFSLAASSDKQVEFRFLRAWNDRQTYALSQWYAWPGGGSPSPSQWFWTDQAAQLRGVRLPWVAVSILIPIEPLGNIDQVLPTAQSLGQAVQSALMSGPLK
ncbi:cyanoexosortase B system-associated protein [Leptolyngbya sp. 'hensonii']|uniref:cyanoexosortase B system-associated protein n=1 Tax=Leptolyngbya sp. 'hensonii' TaxID=1922337 RepID=UPI00094F6994|nr:cyanoexosortase B system-associated protein [Leptolyngbya sp. 'hensonii']OLP17801.1 cyanoexosortase B system-associated protein [Leptolyngbya sp. 'hensonii']